MKTRLIFGIYGEEKGRPRFALNIFICEFFYCVKTCLYILDRITEKKMLVLVVTCMERSI